MRYLSCIFIVSSIFTLPSGNTVKSGTVTFSPVTSGTTQLDITIGSSTVEVDWDSFSIGAGEIVRFMGPGTSYCVVNRVTGTSATSHMGDILSNDSLGTVFLINENGIVIDAIASITTGSFIASTLNLQTYTSGADLTFEGASTQPIAIAGTINTTSGDVVVMANHVVLGSCGAITAVGGARLASAHKVILKQTSVSGERIFIETSASSPVGPNPGVGVDISGTMEALETEIKADGTLYALAINHSGIIQASGCTTLDGRILLQADSLGTSNGTVAVDGGIVGVDNPGCSTGEGPTIDIIGPTITIINNSKIDASGNTAGGSISVHDRDTTGASIASLSILADSTSQLLANACLSGNGGTQTFWANSSTLSSTFKARPLAGAGNGGNITSTSVNYLGYNALSTDLSPFLTGNFGTLTLNAPSMNAGSSDLSASGSQVFQSSLNNALENANVTLNASSGNLNVVDLMSWTSATTLNLIAPDVLLGLSDHSHAYSAGFSGPSATIIGSVENSFGLYAGAGSNNDARLLASSVAIDSQTSCDATLTVEASACCDATIDTTGGSTSIGQLSQMHSVYVNGGCCNNGNIASIGSQTGTSDIQISVCETIELNGGRGIADNTASIEASGGGAIALVAKNLHILAGSDALKTGNYNHAYISTPNTITYNGTNLKIWGAQEGLCSSKGYMQAGQINTALTGNLEIKGGATTYSQAYMQADNNIDISAVGNVSLLGGLDHYAYAFIKSTSGNITIDNGSAGIGALSIVVPTYGGCNAQAYIETHNGDIHIGQTNAFESITLNAGACGVRPTVHVAVTGTGNIKGKARNHMSLYGGGVSEEASHAAVSTNNGNIDINAGLDINVFAGTGVNGHAYVEATNGDITVSVGRNVRMEGSCTIPNYAYMQTTKNSRAMSATVGNNLYLVGNAYLQSNNKNLTIGGQRIVIGCSAPVNPVTPSSPSINPEIPGDYYYEYIFLYELFYRMRYFYPYPFFEGPYFDYANYISP